MKQVWIRVLTLALLIIILFFLGVIINRLDFPLFEYSSDSSLLVEADPSLITIHVSEFLWSYRGMDLLVQALVLFAVAVCTIFLLGTREDLK